MVGALLGLLLWHVAPASIAFVLWWQLRHGVIFEAFGVYSAKRVSEPLGYWLGIVGTGFALLVVAGIVGSVDAAILRSHDWL